MSAEPPPPFNVPASATTVKISVIDSTVSLPGAPCSILWSPTIKGFDRLKAGTWCFLIEHPSGRKLIYDLGCRKDWENLPPAVNLKQNIPADALAYFRVEKNVAEILTEGDDLMPGYPTDPSSHTLDSDFEGRTVQEMDFSESDLRLGRFEAIDYFGDRSFYILNSPGHAVGHINALARTHASPSPGFIHLCGDTVHHAGEMRPTPFQPLPDSIEPSPVPRWYATTCPGHIFEPLLRNGSKSEHILESIDYAAGLDIERKFAGIYDDVALKESVCKTEELDADDDVFTIMAHDWSLKGVIPEWPESLNKWRERRWEQETRWKFLEDFQGACSPQPDS